MFYFKSSYSKYYDKDILKSVSIITSDDNKIELFVDHILGKTVDNIAIYFKCYEDDPFFQNLQENFCLLFTPAKKLNLNDINAPFYETDIVLQNNDDIHIFDYIYFNFDVAVVEITDEMLDEYQQIYSFTCNNCIDGNDLSRDYETDTLLFFINYNNDYMNKDYNQYTSNDKMLSRIVINTVYEENPDYMYNYTFDIINLLGSSNAYILNTRSDYEHQVCIKIDDGGFIKMDLEMIKYINSHPDDFTKVYYYQPKVYFPNYQMNVFDRIYKKFDLVIIEKVDNILSNYIRNNFISMKNFKRLTNKLLQISIDLLNNNYYYTDLKPANIGYNVNDDGTFDYKLIDVDSISRSIGLETPHTQGRIKRNYSGHSVQFLNVFFTLIAVLFNGNENDICNSAYSLYHNNNKLINIFNTIYYYKNTYRKEIGNALDCSSYKYVIIVGTMMMILKFVDRLKINYNDPNHDDIKDIEDNLRDMAEFVRQELDLNRTDNFDLYMSYIFIAMIYVILCKDANRVIDFIFKIINITHNIEDSVDTKYNILMPGLNIGLSYVILFHRYITKHCDDNCYNADKYSYNIFNY